LGGIGAAGGVAAVGAGVTRSARAAGRVPGIDRLRAAKIGVSARAVRFDGGGAASGEVALGAGLVGRAGVDGGALTISAAPVSGSADAVDLLVALRARGRPAPVELSLRLAFATWSRDTYLGLPGACYAGNRFESRHVAYPPLLTEPADIGPNVPPIVSDIPRLNLHPGASGLEAPAADLAIPAAALFLPAPHAGGQSVGLIVLIDPETSLGATGFAVSENDERSSASLVVSTPVAPEDRRDGADGPRGARGAFLRPGEQVTLRARIHIFPCADVPELYARLFAVRKQLTGGPAAAGGRAPAPDHELPFSAAFAAHEERANRRWLQPPGLLAAGGRESAYTTWQTGWCGGLPALLPLLAAGGALSRTRARQTAAYVAAEAQAPSGFFHAVTDGKSWYEDGFTAPLPSRLTSVPLYRNAGRWHLVRRSGDALVSLMKLIALLERSPEARGGNTLRDDLAEAARRVADAFVRLWDRYRQLGQFVDVESGDLLVGGSTSAGSAPAGLALAGAHFNHDGYTRVARAAAEQYHDRYVRAGLTCGGPGDALQCADSESAAGLLESFVTLYELTRERVWIDRAQAAAHLLASWVISFEPLLVAGPGDVRATGGVISDAQNDRGTPGYLLWSGDALFRLYRATGDVALLELLRDTVHNLPRYLRCLGHAEGPGEPQAPGGAASTGRARRTDTRRWVEQPGEVVPTRGALDAIALLAYTEVPGLYAQTDKGFVFTFDHIDARVRERLAGKLVVALANPTRTDARVRILAETASEAAEPLRPGAVLDAPTKVVPAGETVMVALPIDAGDVH